MIAKKYNISLTISSHENVRALRPYHTRHPRPALQACNEAHQNTFLTSNAAPNCTRTQTKQASLCRTGGLLWRRGGARPSALWENSGGGTIEQLGTEMRSPSPQSACQTSLTHRFHNSPQHKQGIFVVLWNIIHGQVLLPAFLEVTLLAEDAT